MKHEKKCDAESCTFVAIGETEEEAEEKLKEHAMENHPEMAMKDSETDVKPMDAPNEA